MQLLISTTTVKFGRSYTLENGYHAWFDFVKHERLISFDEVVYQRFNSLQSRHNLLLQKWNYWQTRWCAYLSCSKVSTLYMSTIDYYWYWTQSLFKSCFGDHRPHVLHGRENQTTIWCNNQILITKFALLLKK